MDGPCNVQGQCLETTRTVQGDNKDCATCLRGCRSRREPCHGRVGRTCREPRCAAILSVWVSEDAPDCTNSLETMRQAASRPGDVRGPTLPAIPGDGKESPDPGDAGPPPPEEWEA
jgi:hypothetical protein